MLSRRGAYDTAADILHPSEVIPEPFDYHEKLYEEMFNPAQDGGFIGADSNMRGVAFWPPYLGLPNSAVSQRYHAVQPASDKRIMLSARFLMDHPGDVDALIGFWATDNAPFGTSSVLTFDDGVVFYHINQTNYGDVHAVARAGGVEWRSSSLFQTAEDKFYDVAIVIHETQFVEFLFLGSQGAWSSVIASENIPSASLRPSFAASRFGLLAGGLVVRFAELAEQEMP